MGIEISRYQFHSWSRKGIAGTIEEPDTLGILAGVEEQRAKISIPVTLNEAPHPKDFSLIGPGDIIGVNRDMIVRTQPTHFITDFEPNYLAFAEFYDEDFLWRYTPAAPKLPGASEGDPPTDKLRPWLFLLVVKEDEFERTKRKVPLSSIKILKDNVLPPVSETYLWAHVHNDANIPDNETNTLEEFLIALNKNVTTDPDQLYCRLLSPRKLKENEAYYAFLIPAFETGRKAGLGETEEQIQNVIAQAASWSENTTGLEMPVYFEWFFRTGANEDFESLIKRLTPEEMDARVGIRDMDCSSPGFLKAKSTLENDPLSPTNPPKLGLEGALKAEKAVSTVYPPASDVFQSELQEVVNLQFEVLEESEDLDPVISVPLYGGKHAKKSVDKDVPLDITKETWLHELNRDPRTRVAAGFGTLAIQKNQETFMRKAWAQVQTIIDANKQIKTTVFHMNIALKFAQKTFSQVSSNVLIAMSRPVLTRIMGSPTTLYQQIKESQLPAAVFSGAFRRMTAPNRRFSKNYSGEKKFDYDQVVTGLNDGKLTAAPAKEIPGGVFILKDAADKISPHKFPAWLHWLLTNKTIVAIILIPLFVFLAIITGLIALFAVLALATATGYFYAEKISVDKNTAEQLLDPQKHVEAIAKIPPQPNFTLKLNKDTTPVPATVTTGGADSVEAKNYRRALTDMSARLALNLPEKSLAPVSLNNTHLKLSEGINPHKTFPKRLHALIKFPPSIKIDEPKTIFPAMAYPDMEDPMYKKLTDISDEAFLPNLKLIKYNTISLLQTNQRFIESYMTGLNHEMGRELLWREYPTDQRGSYFRQFWDVNGIISPSSPDGKLSAAEKLAYKDIKPLDQWDEQTEKLGTHNNRQVQTKNEEQLVLTIRGDLLKKYPNTLVFAQKAVPATSEEEGDEGTTIDLELTDAAFRSKVKFPLYKAEILPDIKFFGFDLTANRAKGVDHALDTDALGWYFVIMQAPGAPVFGMDIGFNPGDDQPSWDDLSWEHLSKDINFVTKTEVPGFNPDDEVTWAVDAASMAYILFQKPNMVAVHAKKMLERLTPP